MGLGSGEKPQLTAEKQRRVWALEKVQAGAQERESHLSAGLVNQVTYNPNHRWLYLPEHRDDEIL